MRDWPAKRGKRTSPLHRTILAVLPPSVLETISLPPPSAVEAPGGEYFSRVAPSRAVRASFAAPCCRARLAGAFRYPAPGRSLRQLPAPPCRASSRARFSRGRRGGRPGPPGDRTASRGFVGSDRPGNLLVRNSTARRAAFPLRRRAVRLSPRLATTLRNRFDSARDAYDLRPMPEYQMSLLEARNLQALRILGHDFWKRQHHITDADELPLGEDCATGRRRSPDRRTSHPDLRFSPMPMSRLQTVSRASAGVQADEIKIRLAAFSTWRRAHRAYATCRHHLCSREYSLSRIRGITDSRHPAAVGVETDPDIARTLAGSRLHLGSVFRRFACDDFPRFNR